MKPGDKWKSRITDSAPIICDRNDNCHEGDSQYFGMLETEVERFEIVNTALGDLKAIKVVMAAKYLRVIRWYAPGIGVVKELVYKLDKGTATLSSEKLILRNISGWTRKKSNRAVRKGEKTHRSWNEKDVQLFGSKYQQLMKHAEEN